MFGRYVVAKRSATKSSTLTDIKKENTRRGNNGIFCFEIIALTIVNNLGQWEHTQAKNVIETQQKKVDTQAYDGNTEVNGRYSNPKLVLLLTSNLITYMFQYYNKRKFRNNNFRYLTQNISWQSSLNIIIEL